MTRNQEGGTTEHEGGGGRGWDKGARGGGVRVCWARGQGPPLTDTFLVPRIPK